MQRLVLDMQREIEWLNERLDNQEIQRGNEFDEEGEYEDKRLGEMSYEDRVLRALEGRSEAIKIDVSNYVGSLKLEELIDWLNDMGNFFEWKPMAEGKKMKFACTKLK